MKRLPVVYLRTAQNDLTEILRYIQRDNPSSAEKFIDSIDRSLKRLASFPNSGVVPKDDRLASLGYRLAVIGEYLAFYVIHSGRVEIRRVLHGRRRYSFLL